MLTERPLVSIVVRTKDRPKLLREALHSIAAQTYRPLEVVVVNDGGCPLPESELGQILGDVTPQFLHSDINLGRARAGNAGLATAHGRYLGFLDDDDRLLPQHVELLAACLEGGEHRICYSDVDICHRHFDPESASFEIIQCQTFASKDFCIAELLCENYIPLNSLLFDRELLVSAEGFDSDFELYEDWDLLLRVGSTHPFFHVPRVTAQYIQWSRELQIAQTDATRRLQAASYDRIIEKHSWIFTPQVALRWLGTLKELEHARQRLADTEQHLAGTQERLVGTQERLTDTEQHLAGTEERLRQTGQQLVAAEAEIEHTRSQLIEARSRLEQGQSLQQELQARLARLRSTTDELALIKASRAWRAIQAYGRVKQAMLPPDSHITRALGGVRRGIRVFRTEGLPGLQRRFSRSFLLSRPLKADLDLDDVEIPAEGKVSLEAAQSELDVQVTVVLPTKNAGDEFERTLKRIKHQWGVRSVHMLVIDSGSKDRTVEIAQAAGAQVIQVAPESFHHAETRNLAAQHASGDVLVFTVQDASPAGHDWLYRLVRPILHGESDAVSARQIHRADADLFAKWATWGYFHYLKFYSDSIREHRDYPDLAQLQPVQRRRVIHLDNTCMAIRKDLFTQFRFRGSYGEDLDLGKRLFQSGYKLLFQVDNAVIHSHNRSPSYFFRRTFVDSLALVEILEMPRGAANSEVVLGTLAWTYDVFCEHISSWLRSTANTRLRRGVRKLITELRQGYREIAGQKTGDVVPVEIGDPGLFRILQTWRSGEPDTALSESFQETLYGNLDSFARYLLHMDDWSFPPDELAETLHKFYAFSAGGFAAMAGAELPAELVQGI